MIYKGTKGDITIISSAENDDNDDINNKTKSNETSWAGDQLPPELLQRTRKRFNLTQEQMDEVLKQSKTEALSKIDSDNSFSVSQTINATVYLSLVCILIYYVNRDYDNAVTKWFIHNFPREAETLSIGKALFKNR